MQELESFSLAVAGKPMLLVASRVDAAGDGDRLVALRDFCRGQGKRLYEISCVTGEGLEELQQAAWAMLEEIPRQAATIPVHQPY
jgi:GTPase involved in cell partitioning and DNA repair